MARVVPQEEYVAAVDALAQAEGNQAEAARSLGLARSTLQQRVARAGMLGLCGTAPVVPGFGIKSVSQQTGKDGELQREWIKQAPVGEQFEIPAGHVVKGVSALTGPSGAVLQQWVKTQEDKEKTIELIHAVTDEMKKSLPRVKPTKGPTFVHELLLNQYTVTDLHFGMLAWAEETGGADYDLKIAEQLLMDWFSAAVAMSPKAKVGVFAQLGDLMHHDALESVTPAHKNVLDADSRLQKIIRVIIRVVRQILSMLLQQHEHVHVIMASANHDPASSAWMRELLHAMYEGEPRITIDNSPDVYYAYEWGNTALFYHHGHKRNVKDVDSVFAGKFRDVFGRCSKSYGHVGHLHNDEIKDGNLMKVERHRTLAPQDAFASCGGWLSERDAKVITYHRDYGEVSRIILSPQMVQQSSLAA